MESQFMNLNGTLNVFEHDLMNPNGDLLSVEDFNTKFRLNVSKKMYNRICRAIPVPLVRLIQNSMQYSAITPALSSLRIGDVHLLDRNCNNKTLAIAFKQKHWGSFNSCIIRDNIEIPLRKKAFSFYLSYPVAPKIKECHFKIISSIYHCNDFLHRRFKFDEQPCSFCLAEAESKEHLFYKCFFVRKFWSDIYEWISLKIVITRFTYTDVVYFMDNLEKNISDTVNLIILMGKYHIHCCRWNKTTPSFSIFIKFFTKYFQSLKMMVNINKRSIKLRKSLSNYLLF